MRNIMKSIMKSLRKTKDGDCVTNIIENFLLNILQEAYYDNEFN